MERIKRLLKEAGISDYIVYGYTERTAELFFVKKQLDTRRIKDVEKFNVTVYRIGEKDVVVGISANGNAPFVCGALAEAIARKALAVAIVCNDGTRLAELADHAIILRTGAEVICGSTRMKAGTAQKMALNMISTMTMVKLGHVTGNFMTSMKPVNKKLLARAVFIVSQVCDVDETAQRTSWKPPTGTSAKPSLITEITTNNGANHQ